jgi:hypothetical protein
MNKTYVWMRNGAFVVAVAPSLPEARRLFANDIGRPSWALRKKWDVGLDEWVRELLRPTPIVIRPSQTHCVFDVAMRSVRPASSSDIPS